jgi:hypothetical protein
MAFTDFALMIWLHVESGVPLMLFSSNTEVIIDIIFIKIDKFFSSGKYSIMFDPT